MGSKDIHDRIPEIEKRIAFFEEAERKAAELSSSVPEAKLYVGVCGVTLGFESFDIVDDLVSIRKVTNQPGVVHICRAANLQHSNYLSVGRYSHLIGAEINVGSKDRSHLDEEKAFLLNISWHTAALIKLRDHNTLFCPVAADESWDTLCLISDNSVDFQLLDDAPRQITFTKPNKVVTIEDVEWVKSNWDNALDLRDKNESLRFGLAFNIMYTWNHTNDIRVALMNIWSGLEALFGDRRDKGHFTDRLAERIANWVHSPTKSEVRKLYNSRCDAVHGRRMNEDGMGKSILKSEILLRTSIIKCIETNTKTLPDWS